MRRTGNRYHQSVPVPVPVPGTGTGISVTISRDAIVPIIFRAFCADNSAHCMGGPGGLNNAPQRLFRADNLAHCMGGPVLITRPGGSS